MPKITSFEELYTTLGALVQAATGRPWWKKSGIQGRPSYPYATIYIVEGMGDEKNVVENVPVYDPITGTTFQQVPWNPTRVDVLVDFYISNAEGNDTVLQAATRLRSALYLEERFWDLWNIAALSGGVRIIDLSTIFIADVEKRAEVRFSLAANIADPLPLTGTTILDVDTQSVTVIHVGQDEVETTVEVVVNDPNDDDFSI